MTGVDPSSVVREFLNAVRPFCESVLEALDAEAAAAHARLEELEAIRRVVRLAGQSGGEAKAVPGQLPPPAVKRKVPRPNARKSYVIKNGKGEDAERADGLRRKLAQSILDVGPLSAEKLSVRTGVSRHGLLSVAYLTKDHRWFEVLDGKVHLTAMGHQFITGKENEEVMR